MTRLSTNYAGTAYELASGWTRRDGLTKTQAEELLDWLDANGYQQRRLSLDEQGFVVCYRSEEFSVAPLETTANARRHPVPADAVSRKRLNSAVA